MLVHLFGATSSPSVCRFALERTAEVHGKTYDRETVNTVKENFYVDDCLKSVNSEKNAIELIKQLTSLLKQIGCARSATNDMIKTHTTCAHENTSSTHGSFHMKRMHHKTTVLHIQHYL